MAVRLAEEWFAICGGCEVTILDIGEPLLEVLEQVQIVHMPVLMDHKLYGQTGEGTQMEIPEAEVGMIAGGIRNEEHKKIAQEMRKKCKTLIALGSCACFGGIPALANQYATEEMLEKVYRGSVTTDIERPSEGRDSRSHRSRLCRARGREDGPRPAWLSDDPRNGHRRAARTAGRQAVHALQQERLRRVPNHPREEGCIHAQAAPG